MPLQKLKSSSLLNNSFFIFLIRFFPSVANLVVLLYYSRQLDMPAYGIYQNFWVQIYFLYPLAAFGIHVLITTYAPSTILKIAQKLSATQYVIYSVWVLLISALFAWLQPSSLNMGWWLPMLFLIVFVAGIILESFIIVLKGFKALLIINILYAISYVLVHKLVLAQTFSHYNIFLYLLLIGVGKVALSTLVVLFNIRKHQDDVHEESRSINEIRTLWLHMGYYDILQTLSTWIDKFVVSLLLTASLSAIYFNGSQNIPFLPIILSAAGSAVLLQMNKVKATNENESLLLLMKTSARYLSCVVFPILFFLMFFRYEVFKVVLPGYIDAVPVFFIMLFILPLRIYSFLTVFQKLHKGHISTTGAIGELILACLLMYPLYLWLGLPGIALSFVISTYAQAFYYMIHIRSLLNVGFMQILPIANLLIKVLIFSSLFMVIHYLLSSLFEARISMLIGMSIMAIGVLTALYVEVRSDKNGNVS